MRSLLHEAIIVEKCGATEVANISCQSVGMSFAIIQNTWTTIILGTLMSVLMPLKHGNFRTHT